MRKCLVNVTFEVVMPDGVDDGDVEAAFDNAFDSFEVFLEENLDNPLDIVHYTVSAEEVMEVKL